MIQKGAETKEILEYAISSKGNSWRLYWNKIGENITLFSILLRRDDFIPILSVGIPSPLISINNPLCIHEFISQ